jgi:hypothetical protein
MAGGGSEFLAGEGWGMTVNSGAVFDRAVNQITRELSL